MSEENVNLQKAQIMAGAPESITRIEAQEMLIKAIPRAT